MDRFNPHIPPKSQKSWGERRCCIGRSITSRRFVPVRRLCDACGNLLALLVAVVAPAVKAGAKDRHQRDDVAGEFLFEGFLRTIFENVDLQCAFDGKSAESGRRQTAKADPHVR